MFFPVSACGTKQTFMPTMSMSASGGKADIPTHSHMSANDPKRTCSRAMGHCDIQSNLTARWVNSGFRCLLKQPDEGLELFDRRVGHDPIGDLSIAPA